MPVLAKVKDAQTWVRETRVRAPLVIAAMQGETLVSGRIQQKHIGALRTDENVTSLKAARPVRPVVAGMRRDIGLPPQIAEQQQKGKGVVIGIVDFGCDFVHANFRHADGRTRIRALWDQTQRKRVPGSPVSYGCVYDRDLINTALATNNPYATLGYDPGYGSHGTHVMDIAAGNGPVPGVAPEAEIVFVHLAASDVPWAGEEVVGRSFADSVQLVEAVRFIFDRAGDQPCVVNLSLGTNGGPHDGSTLVEQALDAMVEERPNRCVVVAAANAYDDSIHALGWVPPKGTLDLPFQIPAHDPTPTELEVWYNGLDSMSAEVITPDGTSLGQVPLGESARIVDQNGKALAFIAHRQADPNNGANTLGIFLDRDVPAGQWIMRLHGVDIADDKGIEGMFHAWIERDDAGQARFDHSVRNDDFTLGSISCGRLSIAVASYSAHHPGQPISWFSSAGPTRTGEHKPEISAPGHDVEAACSQTRDGVITMSGTSMAAPVVAGVVALLLAEARNAGRDLTIDEIRQILASTARSHPAMNQPWDRRYGHGMVDVAAALNAVRNLPGPVVAAAGAIAAESGAPVPQEAS